ncbi:MFS transporter [Pseudonocardia hispaniensis]|uniref:MFS transporter n=1 Tax=Pseudonocardia hispaniensis TaxID=904933 RepID=A0ABW1IX75_9PSEU
MTRRDRRKLTTAASLGNFVEWYDYGIYGYFAAVLAVLFFPDSDTALLNTFAIFGVAFLFRPLGALVAGYLGDKYGRKQMLYVLILLISLATAGIGTLPTHTTLGAGAAMLLVALRILQGLSAGGEYSGAASYVAEFAPDRSRGFSCSWVEMGGLSGFLFGSVLATTMSRILTEEVLHGWAWRIPFFLALPLGLIGYYIRRRLDESPRYLALEESGHKSSSPLRDTVRDAGARRQLGRFMGLTVVQFTSYYVFLTYTPNYMIAHLDIAPTTAYTASTIALAIAIILQPVMGTLSDRVGRKPVMMGSCVAIFLFVLPAYMLMGQAGIISAIAAQCILMICLSGYLGAQSATLAEVFPTRLRVTGFAIGYSLSAAIFGGSASYVAELLVTKTDNPLSPALYVMTAAATSFFFFVKLPETAGISLKDA